MSVAQLQQAAGVTSHGALTGLLADDHTQYLLLAGRAGGQSAFGSPTNGEDLTLAGNGGANPGFINLNSPVIFGPYTGNPSAAYGFDYSVVDNPTGAFIGGGLNFSGTILTGASTFIYESFRGAPTITTGVSPGFAAYTVLQALPRFEAGAAAGLAPLNPLILNAGPRVNNAFTGTKNVGTMQGMNFAPTVGATVSGAVLNVGTITGVTCAPKWGTATGSSINFGIIRGLHCQAPAVGLFQPNNGAETMTAYIGVEINAIPFALTTTKRALRSALTAATGTMMIENTGGAVSEFGTGLIHFFDNTPVQFGGTAPNSQDVSLFWAPAGYFSVFFASTGDDLRLSSPAADRFLFDNVGGNATGEYNFNCARFSLGAQTGAVGNQVGVFVTPARTVTIGGEWSDFLLTQGGNITINAAMGLVAGWTINTPSITLGTGSVTTATGLNIGGNPTNATNRIGLRIISNPTGGGGVNAALWVTAGRSQFDGFIDINKPVALGGGAAPTLGTIGGAGPTAAAQAQWVQIEVAGVNHWIPAWV